MKIDNKYNIGDIVEFEPFMATVIGIWLTGKPLNIRYEVSFFDSADNPRSYIVNDYELRSKKENFGFGKKGE